MKKFWMDSEGTTERCGSKSVAERCDWSEGCGGEEEEHSAIEFGCIRFQVLSVPPRGLC